MQGKGSQALQAGIPVKLPGGKTFYLMSTTGPVSLTFRGYNNQVLEVAPNVTAGIKVTPKEEFYSVGVLSATNQTIEFYITEGQIENDALLGTVSISSMPNVVVSSLPPVNIQYDDSKYKRTQQGYQYIGYCETESILGVNEYSHLQIWNPAGSGRNLYLYNATLIVGTGKNVDRIIVGSYNSLLAAGSNGNMLNKRLSYGRGQTVLRGHGHATPLFPASSALLIYPEDEPFCKYEFEHAFMIEPGSSLVFMHPVINEYFWGHFEWFEAP